MKKLLSAWAFISAAFNHVQSKLILSSHAVPNWMLGYHKGRRRDKTTFFVEEAHFKTRCHDGRIEADIINLSLKNRVYSNRKKSLYMLTISTSSFISPVSDFILNLCPVLMFSFSILSRTAAALQGRNSNKAYSCNIQWHIELYIKYDAIFRLYPVLGKREGGSLTCQVCTVHQIAKDT